MQWCANRLLRFGSDRGGMRGTVVGRKGANVRQREWRMIAAAGDGPYIPCITARFASIPGAGTSGGAAMPCRNEIDGRGSPRQVNSGEAPGYSISNWTY